MGKINEILAPDVELKRVGGNQFHQRLYAIKKGVNGLLDLNRHIYSELIGQARGINAVIEKQDIFVKHLNYLAEVRKIGDQYKIPLRMSHSNQRGFYMQLSVNNQFELPIEMKVVIEFFFLKIRCIPTN